jgi:hypothetical protein
MVGFAGGVWSGMGREAGRVMVTGDSELIVLSGIMTVGCSGSGEWAGGTGL